MRNPFVVALGVFGLVGCTSGGQAIESTESVERVEDTVLESIDEAVSSVEEVPPVSVSEVSAVDGPLMRYPIRSDAEDGMAAEVRGVLQLEDGCLYLSIDEIGERYPVLWPAGTNWDAERETVVLPTGDELAVGGLAYGGGGYWGVDRIADIAGPDAAALAGLCVDNDYGEIAVVNNSDNAIGSR